jgi:hypothetical protein
MVRFVTTVVKTSNPTFISCFEIVSSELRFARRISPRDTTVFVIEADAVDSSE